MITDGLVQWREEHQLRIYEQFQRPDLGDAEGVMCAISAFGEEARGRMGAHRHSPRTLAAESGE